MPEITRELLRKRAEHNEGILTTLEEVSLHQEELESINEVLGTTCRKLKILYLQNNLIPKMENLVHLKDLGYLNLALNNVQKIEGVQNCEFLHKLDLTVNFVDVDELEASMDHLATRPNLTDLYMMGNPCQANWQGFVTYVIAKLPHLKVLDGQEITKSMRIQASQKLPQLEVELRNLAEIKRNDAVEKLATIRSAKACDEIEEVFSSTVEPSETDDLGRELTDHSPEARVKIYRELAQQKKEKADREQANQPRSRDYVAEQAESVTDTRSKEQALEEKEIRQKNEGGWDFQWDEESKKGSLILEVMLPRYLDSSLIDVDCHPNYISVIIKSKILRLRLPAEVKSGDATCLRSKTTGSLMVTMPKINEKEFIGLINRKPTKNSSLRANVPSSVTIPKKLSLQEEALKCAIESRPTLL